jgi:hypothetical protein
MMAVPWCNVHNSPHKWWLFDRFISLRYRQQSGLCERVLLTVTLDISLAKPYPLNIKRNMTGDAMTRPPLARPGVSSARGSAPPSPPAGQPAQKSYKDFNDSWPLNSWSVTVTRMATRLRTFTCWSVSLSKFVVVGAALRPPRQVVDF